MSRLHILAAAAMIATTIASVAPAHAWSKTFAGTRDQVRSACAAVGGGLIEGKNDTTCVNGKNGTGVNCDDGGTCVGSGPGPLPRRAAGIMGMLGGNIVAPTGGIRR